MGLFRHRSISYSIIVHMTLGLALFFYGARALKTTKSNPQVTILLHEDIHRAITPKRNAHSAASDSHQGKSASSHSYRLDLRPSFAKNSDGFPPSTPSRNSSTPNGSNGQKGSERIGEENKDAQNLLHADGRTLQAFDELALMINGHMDYPEILAENGVHGFASLDLYFDHDARIDESRSQMLGNNRWIRGLFVEAARTGLEDWFRGQGRSLKKDQFRDQHFRADFEISYTNTRSSELEKIAENSYHFERRHLVQTCLNGAIDLACAAMRIAGEIQSKTSVHYKIKFEALKDRLEQFDDLGLTGLNQLIEPRSKT